MTAALSRRSFYLRYDLWQIFGQALAVTRANVVATANEVIDSARNDVLRRAGSRVRSLCGCGSATITSLKARKRRLRSVAARGEQEYRTAEKECLFPSHVASVGELMVFIVDWSSHLV
jgi:Mg-chelatase subunit ChlD